MKWTHIIHVLFGLFIAWLLCFSWITFAIGMFFLVIFAIWERWQDISKGTKEGWFDFWVTFATTVIGVGIMVLGGVVLWMT